jgi:ribosomal protein S26
MELRADIRFHKGFHGVTKDSAVSLRPLNLLPWSHWHRWIRFRGLTETAESAPGLSETAEAKLFLTLFCAEKLPFCVNIMLFEILLRIPRSRRSRRSRLPWSHWNRGIRFRGLIETAEVASAVSLRPLKPAISNNYLEFLGDFKPHAKRLDWWKNRESKISWHCHFKDFPQWLYCTVGEPIFVFFAFAKGI